MNEIAGGSAPALLVVEDESDARENMRELLEYEGYEVLVATNGQEAIELLDALGSRPCVVLLDLFMPVMSGWQFVEALRNDARRANVRIVITTSAPEQAPLGFPVIEKPLDADRLLAAIKRYS